MYEIRHTPQENGIYSLKNNSTYNIFRTDFYRAFKNKEQNPQNTEGKNPVSFNYIEQGKNKSESECTKFCEEINFFCEEKLSQVFLQGITI